MNTVIWLAVGSIGISVAAQFVLKAGMSSPLIQLSLKSGIKDASVLLVVAANPLVVGGFVLYALSAISWLAVLARWDVSKAYPLVGLGFAVAAVIGWWFGESIGIQRALGIALICIGVVLVARS